jgi:alpha-D-ribose 1-methylphosphonate 5-triphosphate synthase subunit PhnG
MSGPDFTLNHLSGDISLRALMALPKQRVVDVITRLADGFNVRLTNVPSAGLGLLKFNDSALHDPFYLGEFPLATAGVELTGADGSVFQGAAQVMDDDVEFVTTLAIADAILTNQLSGSDELTELVSQGERRLAREQAIRHSILSRTKVDFSLLNMTEGLKDD